MKIDPTKCIGCFTCVPYCPVSAIVESDKSTIIEDECVDCGVCIRAGVCPVDAIYYPETPWPRSLRAMFSGGARSFGEGFRSFSYIKNKATTPEMSYDDVKQGRVGGGSRGTSEMKTNDITGRFKDEDVGFALEFGRPSVGFRFHEIEKGSMALAKLGVKFEPENPYTELIEPETGRIKEEYRDILNEKALSAIIECIAPKERLPALYEASMKVAKEIDSVFTMDIISKMSGDDVILKPIIDKAGIKVRINGKINVGLGRPLIK
jgi:NAD-dependent dihydropyrimidine dehydrogenase PreA subunit